MSNDNVTPNPSVKRPGNCLLDNLPASPTKAQLKLISNYRTAWLFPAAVIPFILLVLIGGWGEPSSQGTLLRIWLLRSLYVLPSLFSSKEMTISQS